MRKGELPNFRYGQGRPQFNASSSIPNSVSLRIQLKEFIDEQAKINKDTVTKFKSIDKVLENIDSKVTEVGSSNHQVLNMMKVLETQVGQLAGRLTNDEGKLPGQPKGPESAKAIQTRSGKETEDLEHSAGARKLKPSAEAEEIAKVKVTGIATEEPEFEMPGEDTRIPQLKPRYFRGKLDNHFEKFVEVVRRLRGCLGLLCSRFSSSALAPRCQTHLAPRTPLQEKRGAGGQLHVFPTVPQGVLHQLHVFYGVAPAPQTPRWSYSMVEFVERSWKNGSRAVPNTPLVSTCHY
jgi:hypothetical protein